MRAFLAVPIPEAPVAQLARLQATIPFGRPVPEENLHLTLAFLGEAPAPALADLHDLLGAMRSPAVEIRFTALDTFTTAERGLVHVAVARTAALQALHDRLATLCRAAGLDLPRRRFRPHVTLTRANRPPGGTARDRLAAMLGPVPDLPSFTAREVTLFLSPLTPGGAIHEPLSSYPLGG